MGYIIINIKSKRIISSQPILKNRSEINETIKHFKKSQHYSLKYFYNIFDRI